MATRDDIKFLSNPKIGQNRKKYCRFRRFGILLRPGQSFELPGGRGSITFDRVQRFAGFSIRTDPGKILTLVSSMVALGGLVVSLVVRRRLSSCRKPCRC